LAVDIPVIKHTDIVACENNICKLAIARPILSNIPIRRTIDGIQRLSELVTLEEIIISHSPVVVLLGGTADEVGRGGGLESMSGDIYKHNQT
jgi:hypothetical protein